MGEEASRGISGSTPKLAAGTHRRLVAELGQVQAAAQLGDTAFLFENRQGKRLAVVWSDSGETLSLPEFAGAEVEVTSLIPNAPGAAPVASRAEVQGGVVRIAPGSEPLLVREP